MYYPYLRGKNYELLALPTLCDSAWKNCHDIAVCPVIEPVREDHTALQSATSKMQAAGLGFVLIANPRVGDQARQVQVSNFSSLLQHHAHDSYQTNARPQAGLIVDSHDSLSALQTARSAINKEFGDEFPVSLIIRELPDNAPHMTAVVEALQPDTVIFDVETEARLIDETRRSFRTGNRIRLDDPFPRHERNSDYPEHSPQRFTEEFRYYDDDGWDGFGDYLLVGREFIDYGFIPRAVVVHWTYYDSQSDCVMLQHFVSDRQEGLDDVAGKLHEALTKLLTVADSTIHTANGTAINNTEALRQLRELHAERRFSGLGNIKCLSLMNHLEIMAVLAKEAQASVAV